jgi:hypothetical protein
VLHDWPKVAIFSDKCRAKRLWILPNFTAAMARTMRSIVVLLIFIGLRSEQALAQELLQENPTLYTVVLLPEFLTARSPEYDTTFSFEYYDARSNKISLDTVQDVATVHSVSLIKNYTDRAHTYVDKDGKEKPLPVSKIVYRYDRSGPGKWMTIDYATNKVGMLKEFPDEIVRTDRTSVTTNNITQIRVNKYYRVTSTK